MTLAAAAEHDGSARTATGRELDSELSESRQAGPGRAGCDHDAAASSRQLRYLNVTAQCRRRAAAGDSLRGK